MNKRNRFFLLLTVLWMCCILGGCSKVNRQETTITLIHAWGGTEKDHAAMRQIYEDFQKQNPDIKLQMISMPTREDMLRKVEDMIMVGDIPDIISFGGIGENSTYKFMLDNQMALDIQPYIEQNPEFANNISAVNKEYWTTADGHLYTVSDALLLSGGYWYNEDILEAAGIQDLPRNWTEFQGMCSKIGEWALKEQSGVKALQPSAEGYLYFMDHLLIGSDRAEFQNDKLRFHEEIFSEAVEQMKKIYNSSIPENLDYSYRDETQLFNEGKLAIYVNGVWGAPMISSDIHASYALLPSNSGKTMSCESSSLGYVLGNRGDEEREKAAIQFLTYMLSEEVQTRILEKTEQIPANPNISLDRYKETKSRLYQGASLVMNAEVKTEVPDNLWTAAQKNYFEKTIFEVLSGKTSAKEFEHNIRKYQ